MKKIYSFIFGACLLAAAATAVAEKIVDTHTVNLSVYDGYAVDDKGKIVMYTNAFDGSGYLELVTWVYNHGTKTDKEWSGALTSQDIPDQTTAFEIIGLARHYILVEFTEKGGGRYYATFKLRKNDMKLHGGPYSASSGEEISMAKNKLKSITYIDGQPRLIQEMTLKFKASTKKKVTGLGVISEINQPIGKHYQDVSGTGVLTVRVIKP